MFVQNNATFIAVNGEVTASLSPGYYNFRVPNTGPSYFEYLGTLPTDLVDKFGRYVGYKNRIVSYYQNHCSNNLGILFEGVPGSGKSFLVKQLISDLNLPVIFVNSENLKGLIPFLVSKKLQVVLSFEEFEKDDWDDVLVELLSLLDGVYETNKIVSIFSTNCLDTGSLYLMNRPGRIRYFMRFSLLTVEEINKLLEGKSTLLKEAVDLVKHLTLDQFLKLEEEANIFPDLTPQELVEGFNVNLKQFSRVEITDEYDEVVDTLLVEQYSTTTSDTWDLVLKTKAHSGKEVRKIYHKDVDVFFGSSSFRDKNGLTYTLSN